LATPCFPLNKSKLATHVQIFRLITNKINLSKSINVVGTRAKEPTNNQLSKKLIGFNRKQTKTIKFNVSCHALRYFVCFCRPIHGILGRCSIGMDFLLQTQVQKIVGQWI
jgi:hypothetical protein